MTLEGVCCEARHVREIVREWEKANDDPLDGSPCEATELLVPGLRVGERNGVPIFEETWVSISRIWESASVVNFTLLHGPGWITYPKNRDVRVRAA